MIKKAFCNAKSMELQKIQNTYLLQGLVLKQ